MHLANHRVPCLQHAPPKPKPCPTPYPMHACDTPAPLTPTSTKSTMSSPSRSMAVTRGRARVSRVGGWGCARGWARGRVARGGRRTRSPPSPPPQTHHPHPSLTLLVGELDTLHPLHRQHPPAGGLPVDARHAHALRNVCVWGGGRADGQVGGWVAQQQGGVGTTAGQTMSHPCPPPPAPAPRPPHTHPTHPPLPAHGRTGVQSALRCAPLPRSPAHQTGEQQTHPQGGQEAGRSAFARTEEGWGGEAGGRVSSAGGQKSAALVRVWCRVGWGQQPGGA